MNNQTLFEEFDFGLKSSGRSLGARSRTKELREFDLTVSYACKGKKRRYTRTDLYFINEHTVSGIDFSKFNTLAIGVNKFRRNGTDVVAAYDVDVNGALNISNVKGGLRKSDNTNPINTSLFSRAMTEKIFSAFNIEAPEVDDTTVKVYLRHEKIKDNYYKLVLVRIDQVAADGNIYSKSFVDGKSVINKIPSSSKTRF